MMTAANRLGLYSALRAWRAIVLRSSRQSRLTVATMFLEETRGCKRDKGETDQQLDWIAESEVALGETM